MFKLQKGLTDKTMPLNLPQYPPTQIIKFKLVSQTPHLKQTQQLRRDRFRLKRQFQNYSENSNKSFRIQSKRGNSLQNHTINIEKNSKSNTLLIKIVEKKEKKKKKLGLVSQNEQQLFYQAILNKNNAPKSTAKEILLQTSKNHIFQKSENKKRLRTLQINRLKSQQHSQKILRTTYGCIKSQEKSIKQPKNIPNKKVPLNKQNNLRRNKYEIQSSSMRTIDDDKTQLNSKHQNMSINNQMDKLAAKFIKTYYQEITNKQIHKHIQRQTQGYFNEQFLRRNKTKDQIQRYLHTIKHPFVSQLPQNQKDTVLLNKPLEEKIEQLNYDFQFDDNLHKNQGQIENNHKNDGKDQDKEEKESI